MLHARNERHNSWHFTYTDSWHISHSETSLCLSDFFFSFLFFKNKLASETLTLRLHAKPLLQSAREPVLVDTGDAFKSLPWHANLSGDKSFCTVSRGWVKVTEAICYTSRFAINSQRLASVLNSLSTPYATLTTTVESISNTSPMEISDIWKPNLANLLAIPRFYFFFT